MVIFQEKIFVIRSTMLKPYRTSKAVVICCKSNNKWINQSINLRKDSITT